jgi:hypothetical protein
MSRLHLRLEDGSDIIDYGQVIAWVVVLAVAIKHYKFHSEQPLAIILLVLLVFTGVLDIAAFLGEHSWEPRRGRRDAFAAAWIGQRREREQDRRGIFRLVLHRWHLFTSPVAVLVIGLCLVGEALIDVIHLPETIHKQDWESLAGTAGIGLSAVVFAKVVPPWWAGIATRRRLRALRKRSGHVARQLVEVRAANPSVREMKPALEGTLLQWSSLPVGESLRSDDPLLKDVINLLEFHYLDPDDFSIGREITGFDAQRTAIALSDIRWARHNAERKLAEAKDNLGGFESET